MPLKDTCYMSEFLFQHFHHINKETFWGLLQTLPHQKKTQILCFTCSGRFCVHLQSIWFAENYFNVLESPRCIFQRG